MLMVRGLTTVLFCINQAKHWFRNFTIHTAQTPNDEQNDYKAYSFENKLLKKFSRNKI